MFKQIFQSVPPPYRTEAELKAGGFFFPGISYNPYLLEPPRLYAEEMFLTKSLYVRRERTPYSDFTIHLMGMTSITIWPSWALRHWKFDGDTGAFLGYGVTPAGFLLTSEVVEGADGSLWISVPAGDWNELNPDSMVIDPASLLDNAKYGNPAAIEAPLVDRTHDILMRAWGSGVAKLRVYNFGSGAWLRDIAVSGAPAQIMAESERHAFVYCTNGIFNLVDYIAGKVLSTFKAPAPANTQYLVQLGSQRFAYDRFHRRLLAFQMVANHADGSSASSILGWYPVPQAVYLTKPIPLAAPRMNQKIPCLVRLIGDCGEPVSGANVTGSATGAGTSVTPGATDNNGEAIVSATCIASGDTTLTTTATL
jgi:hypothetical protein